MTTSTQPPKTSIKQRTTELLRSIRSLPWTIRTVGAFVPWFALGLIGAYLVAPFIATHTSSAIQIWLACMVIPAVSVVLGAFTSVAINRGADR